MATNVALDESRSKVPITVLMGFLGAGKTTLLNHLLSNNQGLKIGVVVNDYGSINIDSELIAKKTEDKLELTNGCMCCSANNIDLSDVIRQLTYPGSEIDYIVVEASGLAEPKDIVPVLMSAAGKKTRLGSVVTVLDAENIESNAQGHHMALDQITYSDIQIINKVDLVSKEKVKSIHAFVKSVNEKARIIESTKGQVDTRLVLDPEQESAVTAAPSSHEHYHDAFSSFTFESPKPLNPVAFQEFINQKLPAALFRAKGFVNFGSSKGQGRKYILQVVGKRADMAWSEWNANESPVTKLVFIGINLSKEEIRSALNNCVDPKPDEPLPGKQIMLARYERTSSAGSWVRH